MLLQGLFRKGQVKMKKVNIKYYKIFVLLWEIYVEQDLDSVFTGQTVV